MLLLTVLLSGLAAAAADPPPDKPDKACMVYYGGRVQGVGFRATAAEIARDYPVTGWVKNLSDGRVQLLVEGPAGAVDKFLKANRDRWQDNIDKVEMETQTPTGKYRGFEIVR